MSAITELNTRLLQINSRLSTTDWTKQGSGAWTESNAEINALAHLIRAVDEYLCGKAEKSKRTYFQHAAKALRGAAVTVHLSDAGASRIYLSATNRQDIITLDYGMSLPPVIKQWKSWIAQEKPTNISF